MVNADDAVIEKADENLKEKAAANAYYELQKYFLLKEEIKLADQELQKAMDEKSEIDKKEE